MNKHALYNLRISLSDVTVFIVLFILLPQMARAQDQAPIRIGIIGLDTSHSPAFTRIFNDPAPEADVAGFRVVAAYPFGSQTIKSSYSRIPGYTTEVESLGVEIVDSIDELLRRVDVILLETNDGRPHLDQALQVIESKKPLFIDKPVAGSLVDAIKIFDAAEAAGVPVFSSSSMRFMENAQAIRAGSLGEVLGADVYSPATLEPSHPDLFWYGIHGIETLYTVMGPGCEAVQRFYSEGTDTLIGYWPGDKRGTFRGIREGKKGYGGVAFGSEAIGQIGPYEGYSPLVAAIASFFKTGIPPVSSTETLEIYTFMAAAEASKLAGGQSVQLSDVFEQAQREARQP